MKARIVAALAAKDFALYFRNRFVAVIVVLGMALFVVVYFVMPREVDETLRVGLYAATIPAALQSETEEGLELVRASSEEELRRLVLDETCLAGIALDLAVPSIRLYLLSDVAPELREALAVLVEEIGHSLAGTTISLEVDERVIGPDFLGHHVPPRDRMRPLAAVMLLVMEMLGLASLISEEIQHRTLQALLVTPTGAADLCVAKGIVGVLLALGQSVLYMLVVRGFGSRPLLVLTALALGAVMAVGVAFLVGAVARDFASVVYWGMLFMIPLFVPAVTVLVPGSASSWVRLIPSYHLVDALDRVTVYGAGWAGVRGHLAILLGFDVVLVAAGVLALRRKMP